MKARNAHATLIAILLLVAVGILTFGCSPQEEISPITKIIGIYKLVEVDGKAIPAELTHGSVSMEVIEGSLTFAEDGSCKSITVFKPASRKKLTREVSAACTQDGKTLTMNWEGAGITVGTIEDHIFTMNNEGMIFVYKK